MSGLLSTHNAATGEALGHRIQQSLQVILAGLDERVALSGLDIEALRRDLRMLLELERIQIATAEIDRAEKFIEYMLRPNIEECLNLWFGKSEQTDQEISHRFGADVVLASRGHYDHWALDVAHPGDHARPVPAQHVPRHAADICL